jgi:calcium-dependent protein kinase
MLCTLFLVQPQDADSQSTHTFVSLSLIRHTPTAYHTLCHYYYSKTPFGKPIEEIYEGVHDGPVLGSGVSGVVRLVAHRATGIKYAVKCLDIGLIDSTEGLRQLRDEIFIMCQLDHPNIVRIDEVYESTNEIYIVQELCHGGDLFDRLDEQPDYHYTEAQCARLVKQMLSSVRYLHSKGVIHRDLKLENFLFSSVKPESELKMIDFGLSKHFLLGEHHHEKGEYY